MKLHERILTYSVQYFIPIGKCLQMSYNVMVAIQRALLYKSSVHQS